MKKLLLLAASVLFGIVIVLFVLDPGRPLEPIFVMLATAVVLMLLPRFLAKVADVIPRAGLYERFTDRARKVMQLANKEAQRLNHEFIGTEHILLGLVKEGTGVAANVLKNLDIDLPKIRGEVDKIVVAGPDMANMRTRPLTPWGKELIEYAIEEARDLNHNYVGTEHLLLGLLRAQKGVAAQVLMNLGLDPEDVREEIRNVLGH